MTYISLIRLLWIPTAMICALALACGCLADDAGRPGAMLGTMKADRILVLGNSVTLHGIHLPYGWKNYCGMAASVPEKDYVHVLVASIDARTGGHLRISPTDTTKPGPNGATITEPANVLNIADPIERQYATYTNAKLQPQLDWKADLVVLQCGENTPRDTFQPEAFKAALQTLMAGLKASSNPHIFVTSNILGANPAMDEIKRQLCAEDPSHRIFVDLNSFGQDPKNFASAEPYYTGVITGHPGDKGMAVIADALFKGMVPPAEH